MTTETRHNLDAEVKAELYHETHLPTAPGPADSPAAVAPHGRPHIVVGTDGSGPAQEALRWAMQQAVQTGARLTLVRVWKPGEPVGTTWLGGTVVEDTKPPNEQLVLEMEAQVQELQRMPEGRSVRIDTLVLGGRAADILLDQSQSADLLVVGSRGRGAVRSALLGSVSQQVTARAACPVVVVPPGLEAS